MVGCLDRHPLNKKKEKKKQMVCFSRTKFTFFLLSFWCFSRLPNLFTEGLCFLPMFLDAERQNYKSHFYIWIHVTTNWAHLTKNLFFKKGMRCTKQKVFNANLHSRMRSIRRNANSHFGFTITGVYLPCGYAQREPSPHSNVQVSLGLHQPLFLLPPSPSFSCLFPLNLKSCTA